MKIRTRFIGFAINDGVCYHVIRTRSNCMLLLLCQIIGGEKSEI